MTQEQIEELRNDHKFSLDGVLAAYPFKLIIKTRPFRISLLLAILITTMSLFFGKTFYFNIDYWSTQVMSIFPNLLGFNLGGYALIIGFGNTSLVKALTNKGKSGFSPFQVLSSVFAFTLLLQVSTFFFALLVNWYGRAESDSNLA